MAKAKKTTSEETETKSAAPKAAKPVAEKKPAAEKKAPAKKAAAKTAAPAETGVPLIDTNLAAASAATMLRNRSVLGTGASVGQETSTFKNMKDQIAKPKSASLSNLLGGSGDAKKSVSHFMNQQKSHNQTSGGFNKTGVPRRTNG